MNIVNCCRGIWLYPLLIKINNSMFKETEGFGVNIKILYDNILIPK